MRWPQHAPGSASVAGRAATWQPRACFVCARLPQGSLRSRPLIGHAPDRPLRFMRAQSCRSRPRMLPVGAVMLLTHPFIRCARRAAVRGRVFSGQPGGPPAVRVRRSVHLARQGHRLHHRRRGQGRSSGVEQSGEWCASWIGSRGSLLPQPPHPTSPPATPPHPGRVTAAGRRGRGKSGGCSHISPIAGAGRTFTSAPATALTVPRHPAAGSWDDRTYPDPCIYLAARPRRSRAAEGTFLFPPLVFLHAVLEQRTKRKLFQSS